MHGTMPPTDNSAVTRKTPGIIADGGTTARAGLVLLSACAWIAA
jgi:hypothetical protein